MKISKLNQGYCLTDLDAQVLLTAGEVVNHYTFDLCQMMCSYCMNSFWKSVLIVSFSKVRESHLHDVYPVNYEGRKIDGMQFWPLPPEILDVSGNSRPSNGKHACGGTEPRKEVMWNHHSQIESLTCWGMWYIKSYSIKVAIMTWKGSSCCIESDRIRKSIPWQ